MERSAPSRSTPARLEQLTALRFFAALAVLASHLWQLEEVPGVLQPLARTLFHEGYAGVSFFFVLSGFILSHSYREPLVRRSISRWRYFALRLARILPLHWLTALPFAIWLLATAGWSALPRVLANLMLVQSWIPADRYYFSLNQPSWSLSDEAFFYAAFAGLALLPRRRLALLASLLGTVVLSLTAWRVTGGHGTIRNGDGMTFTHWLTYISPTARLLDFMAGMVLYACPRPKLDAIPGTLLEVAAIGLLAGAMVLFPLLGLVEAWRMQLAYLPFMALTIYAFALGRGALSRRLARSRRLVLLGDASFALYLIHLPILHAAFAPFADPADLPLPLPVFAALIAAFAVASSVAVFRWIEQPLQRRLRRLLNPRRDPQNSAAQPIARVRGATGA